jgi:hypothetical protein
VNTPEEGVVPERGEGDRCWCSVRVHLPIDDPAAVVADGGERMNYREGYYILCTVCDCGLV